MIYVLAYPTIDPDVSRSLAGFREGHEPERAGLVAPHVTLDFGLRATSSEAILRHCAEVALETAAIFVEFSRREVTFDRFEKMHKVFFVSDLGEDAHIALHWQLHDGPHRTERNADVPYRPHMTVATNADRAHIEEVDTAPIGAVPIKATIGGIEVVRLTDGTLSSIASVPFGGYPARSRITEPTEYPAPNEQISPVSPGVKSLEYLANAMIDPAEEVLA